MTSTHRGQNSQFLVHLLLCKRIKCKINKLSKSKPDDSFCEPKILVFVKLCWWPSWPGSLHPSERSTDRGREGALLPSGTGQRLVETGSLGRRKPPSEQGTFFNIGAYAERHVGNKDHALPVSGVGFHYFTCIC